jgi:hypothetical protein
MFKIINVKTVETHASRSWLINRVSMVRIPVSEIVRRQELMLAAN